MRQEVIQQDIPLSMKLRLVLYFPPWISFSTLHLYSPTSLAELIVKLNNAGIKSVLFKVDTFWLALNSVYLRGGEPESEWQERLTFWFNITSKVPWTGVRMGLESISGKKKLLSELIAPIIQESLPPSPPPPFFFSPQNMLRTRLYLFLLKQMFVFFTTSSSRQCNFIFFSVSI